MNLKTAVSLAILIPLLSACGGSGDDSPGDNTPAGNGGTDPVVTDPVVTDPVVTDPVDPNPVATGPTVTGVTDPSDTSINPDPTCCLLEDRTLPGPGSVLTSSLAPVLDNRDEDSPNAGPQPISLGNNISFPGLRYGNFLMLNNAFNAGNTQWTDWRQSIALNDGSPVTMDLSWDWGLESQKFQPFETISFPELVYGTKSAFERSGTFQETGLPVEEANRPDITITYDYSRFAGVTEAPAGPNDNPSDSEHNVIIESFWHDSCEIVRNGGPNDNQVMEMLIWYYHGERLPSGPMDIVDTGVMIDGFPFTVYRKASNFNFLAYVAEDVDTAERTSGTINYSAFIEDTIANASTYNVYQVQPTDCFANILFGPEVFQGAGTFTINNFEVTRSY